MRINKGRGRRPNVFKVTERKMRRIGKLWKGTHFRWILMGYVALQPRWGVPTEDVQQ